MEKRWVIGLIMLFLIVGDVCALSAADEAYNRGSQYLRNNMYDEAIAEFNEAIRINPNDASAYCNRGMAYVYAEKPDLDQAISDCKKAIELKPGYGRAYNNLAVAYYSKREYGKSWESIHKAEALGYEVHPGFLEALKEASGRDR